DLAFSVEIGDLGRAQIKHRPTRRIVDRPAQRLRQAGPGQPYLHHGILKMLRGQPRGAERPVLLLRMLEDQDRDAVIERLDAVADAKRLWLPAMRTLRDCLFASLLGWFGHPPPIRRAVPRFNRPVPHVQARRASETRARPAPYLPSEWDTRGRPNARCG